MLEVKDYHECVKPSMETGTKDVYYAGWRWWKKGEVVGSEPIYIEQDARWTCPRCKSVWKWQGYWNFWTIIERTYKWKKVPS